MLGRERPWSCGNDRIGYDGVLPRAVLPARRGLFVNAFEVPPPPNDDIRSATLISQSDLPYESFPFVDVGLSTSAPSDPRCLGQGGSVWYRFRPGFDMWAEVATNFPDADYVLAVVAVSPRGIRLLGCADDTVPPPPELPDQRASERMRFWAKAGVSYSSVWVRPTARIRLT